MRIKVESVIFVDTHTKESIELCATYSLIVTLLVNNTVVSGMGESLQHIEHDIAFYESAASG